MITLRRHINALKYKNIADLGNSISAPSNISVASVRPKKNIV